VKLGLPLYGKFLLWLVANILIVGWAAFFYFPERFGRDWNALLTDSARERLQSVGEQLANHVGPIVGRGLKVNLRRYEDEQGVRFGIFDADGRQIAGADYSPPQPVVEQLLRTQVLVFAAIPGPLRKNLGAFLHGGKSSLALPDWPPLERYELQRQQFVMCVADRWWFGVRTVMRGSDGTLQPVTVLADTSHFWRLAMFIDLSAWLAAALLIVLLSIVFWLPFLWSISRAMSGILRAVERIADGHFDVRSGIARDDELGRLAQAVDTVGGRLESYVNSQKHFLADIAHEVWSPLGRLQLGLGILEEHLPKSAKPAFDDVYEEAQLMSELIKDLLAFSRAGVNDTRRPMLPTSLKGVVLDTLDRENARDRVLINVPESLQVRVNTSLLGRALGNLVRNALRYAGTEAGPIEVVARSLEKEISVRVMDRGPGVPELALLKLGDPFYRPEVARSRSSGGIGLGLATVRNCITSCGGKVIFRNRTGGGFEAEIHLPMPDL
jgi:two-component system sensor histidine kinase CpxA